jgi:phosphatidate cytidylyltransferase
VTNGNQHDANAGGTVAIGAARNFWQRVASAAVLVPAALACTYIGGWLFLVVCAIAAAAILWEWTSLVVRSADAKILAPGLIALLAATGLAGASEPGAAVAMIAVGAVLAGGFIAASPSRDSGPTAAAWAGGGVAYAGVALLSPVLLRNDAALGLSALLFLFAIVWATDVLAYLVGRAVGGPLLWPRLSPNKTWSGAFGGLFGGVAAGILVAYASAGIKPAVAGILALVLSIVAQSGDLFESAVKRRFGAKDAGNLIPGHGGVMDRLDGFLVAALVAVLIGVLRQGMAAPARGLLVW